MIQHLVVRMLFDPDFRAAVYAGPVEGLNEAHRAWLTAPDPRRWRADPLRQARVLTSLVQEFPAAAATHGAAGLDRFFASPEFNDCVTDRGSLAAAFGAWLGTPIAQLEAAIAQVRRAPQSAAGPLRRAPWVVCVRCPAGTLVARTAWLAQTPQTQWASVSAPPPTWPDAGQEHLVVERRPDGVAVTPESPEIVAALEAFEPPADPTAILTGLGLEPEDVPDVVAAWRAEGWLVGQTPR